MHRIVLYDPLNLEVLTSKVIKAEDSLGHLSLAPISEKGEEHMNLNVLLLF